MNRGPTKKLDFEKGRRRQNAQKPDYRDLLQNEPGGGRCYEEDKMALRWSLKQYVFVCRGRRCKPESDLTSFLELNDLKVVTPETEQQFLAIKRLVDSEFEALIKSIALSNPQAARGDATANPVREFLKLYKPLLAQGKRPHAIPELMLADYKPPGSSP